MFPPNPVSSFLEKLTGLPPELQFKVELSIVVALSGFILFRIGCFLFQRQIDDPKRLYRSRKGLYYTLVTLCLAIIGRLWFDGIDTLATFFGLLSAGVAIALKDIVVGFAGWLFILWRKPFEVGDRIQIGDHAGDVIDQALFFFTLMEIGEWVECDQSTGRILHIPNGKVFNQPLANYTKGFHFMWNEIAVLITFESNWQKGKDILREIADNHSLKFNSTARKRIRRQALDMMILYSTLSPTVYTSVKDSGVQLTIRYLCQPRQRRVTEEKLWEDVLKHFAQHEDLEFAYPTTRFFTQQGISSDMN